MYNVTKKNHETYGNVIEITKDEDGSIKTPFQAEQLARKERRVWSELDGTKVRFLVDGKIIKLSDLEHWGNEEYKSLPKCQGCGSLLDGQVYTHSLSGTLLFCQQVCANKDYSNRMEHLNDFEEFDL